jgi:hypothetical protein
MHQGSVFRHAPLIAVVLLGAVLALGCNLVGGPAPTAEPTSSPSTEGMSLTAALAIPPDDGRPTVLTTLGPPDAFSLRFDELEGQSVRWETWSYFDFGTRFDFVDGELLWTVALEPVPDGAIYAHFYEPDDFQAGMTIAQTKALLDDQVLDEIDLSDVDLEGGVALAGDQILLGFQDDRLVFVETVILAASMGEEAER